MANNTSTNRGQSPATAPSQPLAELTALGQSVWLDFITRNMIHNGELHKLIQEDGVRGVTSNPSIFEQAISAGDAYDQQLRTLAEQAFGGPELFEALAVQDIQGACDLFLPLYESTGGQDGFVSIEVSPGQAYDTEATLIEARRLWQAVDRPNVMVKVPGTPEGLPAIEQLLSEGLNINITLLFSIDRHEEVMWAYIRALEARQVADESLDNIASVASFFVSRVDTLVDRLLEEQIRAETHPATQEKLRGLLGKAAIANAKLAYARFQEIFGGERFEQLQAAGARVQRPLWASTSTKNPEYRDVRYVEELIGPHTVNTMPLATMTAFQDHGAIRRTLDEGLDDAQAVLDALHEVGIDYHAITQQLEQEGVAAFAKSYDSLIAHVEQKAAAMRSR